MAVDPHYQILIDRFPLRPFRSEEDCWTAARIMDELAGRPEVEPAERDYARVLGLLIVEHYEAAARTAGATCQSEPDGSCGCID